MTKTNPKAEQPSTDVDKAIEFSLDTGIDVSQEFSSKYIGEYGAWGLGNVLKFTFSNTDLTDAIPPQAWDWTETTLGKFGFTFEIPSLFAILGDVGSLGLSIVFTSSETGMDEYPWQLPGASQYQLPPDYDPVPLFEYPPFLLDPAQTNNDNDCDDDCCYSYDEVDCDDLVSARIYLRGAKSHGHIGRPYVAEHHVYLFRLRRPPPRF